MNKILVEVSVGELLDKISILEIKKERIKEKGNDSYGSFTSGAGIISGRGSGMVIGNIT